MLSKKFSHFSVIKLSAFLATLCLSAEVSASDSVAMKPIISLPASGCHYIPLVENNLENTQDNFLHELITRADHPTETFASLYDSFVQNRSSYHHFEFKYALKDQEHAQRFAKAMYIKAQQPHRFIPSVLSSECVTPSHLGFTRKLKIGFNGATVQEHVLVDRLSNSILFIEDWVSTEKGTELGSFAALNQIMQENGVWYFAGSYLYGNLPNEAEVQNKTAMFFETYQNMMNFVENENVDEIYNHLHQF